MRESQRRFLFGFVLAAGLALSAQPATGYLVYGTNGEGASARKCERMDCPIVRTVPEGTEVSVDCFDFGDWNIALDERRSPIWVRLTDGAWINNLYVNTGVVDYLPPGTIICREINAPAPTWSPIPLPPPRTTLPPRPSNIPASPAPKPKQLTREDKAIAWARSMIGKINQPDGKPWWGWCDRFVANAFGKPNSGYASANVHWSALAKRGLTHTGSPPAGSLAFWATGKYGHVALSIGGGKVITTPLDIDNPKRIREMGLRVVSGYRGWSWANPEWKGL